jgi:hypothetical protein
MDVEFSLRSETQAITVSIYGRLRELKNQGMEPVLIRLGELHTRRFLKEHWLERVPKGPAKPKLRFEKYVVWGEDLGSLCLSYDKGAIPIKFNDTSIFGIEIDAVPRKKP